MLGCCNGVVDCDGGGDAFAAVVVVVALGSVAGAGLSRVLALLKRGDDGVNVCGGGKGVRAPTGTALGSRAECSREGLVLRVIVISLSEPEGPTVEPVSSPTPTASEKCVAGAFAVDDSSAFFESRRSGRPVLLAITVSLCKFAFLHVGGSVSVSKGGDGVSGLVGRQELREDRFAGDEEEEDVEEESADTASTFAAARVVETVSAAVPVTANAVAAGDGNEGEGECEEEASSVCTDTAVGAAGGEAR